MNFLARLAFLSNLFDDYSTSTPKYEKIDINQLKKTGVVTEEITEENGCKTTVLTYKAFDGSKSFKHISSHPIGWEDMELEVTLHDKLNKAITEQRFEDAAILRDEINSLKKGNAKPQTDDTGSSSNRESNNS